MVPRGLPCRVAHSRSMTPRFPTSGPWVPLATPSLALSPRLLPVPIGVMGRVRGVGLYSTAGFLSGSCDFCPIVRFKGDRNTPGPLLPPSKPPVLCICNALRALRVLITHRTSRPVTRRTDFLFSLALQYKYRKFPKGINLTKVHKNTRKNCRENVILSLFANPSSPSVHNCS